MIQWAPEVRTLARCQWCGTTSKDIHRLNNGRSELLLCDMCLAQKEVLDQPSLRLEDLARPPSLWERVLRLFRG